MQVDSRLLDICCRTKGSRYEKVDGMEVEVGMLLEVYLEDGSRVWRWWW